MKEETYVPAVSNTIELLYHKESIVYLDVNILRLTLDNKLISNGVVLLNLISNYVFPQIIEIDFDAISDGCHVEKIVKVESDTDLKRIIIFPYMKALPFNLRISVTKIRIHG